MTVIMIDSTFVIGVILIAFGFVAGLAVGYCLFTVNE